MRKAHMKRTALFLMTALGLMVLLPELSHAHAQAGLPDASALASQNLRGYTHMFIAYAIAWILVLGWVISIARRLGRVEEALKE